MGNPKNQFPVDNFAIARTSGQIKGAKLDKDFSSNNFFRTSPINTPTLPVILSFTVTPAIPASGQNQVLSWVTTGGTSQSIDQGIGAVAASGNMTVAPSTNVTYTLSVTNNVGTVTQQVTATPILTPIENVFSAYTFNGNGGVQSINNGINLASSGGLVWLKQRSSVGAPELYDTVRGAANSLQSSNTSANSPGNNDLTAFLSNGFTLGFQSGQVNVSGQTQVAWTFAQAPGFFAIVPYTGNGVNNRAIAHALGVVPGLIIIRNINGGGTANWLVWHNSFAQDGSNIILNSTGAKAGSSPAMFGTTAPTNATFSVGTGLATDFDPNINGQSYIAYLFAHDTSATGLIQCGSFVGTGDVNNPAIINLGWEPQFVLAKPSSGVGDWDIMDTARGLLAGPTSNSQVLIPNATSAEAAFGGVQITPSGFLSAGGGSLNAVGVTYLYMAIRRGPMSQPTLGTQVYQGIARTGTSTAATITGLGFPPDMFLHKWRASAGSSETALYDRSRGRNQFLNAMNTGADNNVGTATNDFVDFQMDGFGVGANTNTTINALGQTEINWLFRRAPGVFDIIAYRAKANAAQVVPHNLGVAPELLIIKNRTTAGGSWVVLYGFSATQMHRMYLSSGNAESVATYAAFAPGELTIQPDATQLSLGTGPGELNNASDYYIGYLFATLAGISKVGSYTGNGTSLALACGFVGNARFFMVKRTDAIGDWFVWDNTRGIGAGNDPHLSINTTNAEVTTDDSVSAFTGGITVNQVAATNINVLNGTYIFLAIA